MHWCVNINSTSAINQADSSGCASQSLCLSRTTVRWRRRRTRCSPSCRQRASGRTCPGWCWRGSRRRGGSTGAGPSGTWSISSAAPARRPYHPVNNTLERLQVIHLSVLLWPVLPVVLFGSGHSGWWRITIHWWKWKEGAEEVSDSRAGDATGRRKSNTLAAMCFSCGCVWAFESWTYSAQVQTLNWNVCSQIAGWGYNQSDRA